MKNKYAFPSTWENETGKLCDDQGMTLRDYFAGQALQALILRDGEEADCINVITTTAYQYADDMLKERLV